MNKIYDFLISSLCTFVFLFLVSVSSHSSSLLTYKQVFSNSRFATCVSICHHNVFVTEVNGRDELQTVGNLQGSFWNKKRYKDDLQKHAKLQGRFAYLSLIYIISLFLSTSHIICLLSFTIIYFFMPFTSHLIEDWLFGFLHCLLFFIL